MIDYGYPSLIEVETYWGRRAGTKEWQLIGRHSQHIAAALHFAQRQMFTNARTIIELKCESQVDSFGEPTVLEPSIIRMGNDYNVELENPDREALRAEQRRLVEFKLNANKAVGLESMSSQHSGMHA